MQQVEFSPMGATAITAQLSGPTGTQANKPLKNGQILNIDHLSHIAFHISRHIIRVVLPNCRGPVTATTG